jgi:hypothetical protein
MSDVMTLSPHRHLAPQPRNIEEIWRKLGALIDIGSPSACSNCLANSGYASR